MLEFRSSPDYDTPADAGVDNTYKVVVQATDGDAGAATATPEDTRSWFKVTVNVSDVEEHGVDNAVSEKSGGTGSGQSASCHAAPGPGWGGDSLASNLTDGDGTSA